MTHPAIVSPQAAELARLRAERAELVEAFGNLLESAEKLVWRNMPEWDGTATPTSDIGAARAALARVKGEG